VTIRERTEIRRSAATVWPYVITPEHFQKWNGKIAAMEARGTFQRGQRFVTQYQWNRRQVQCWSMATTIEEGHLLELLHSNFQGRGVKAGMEVRERITLEEKGDRTLVTKHVKITNHGIPWIFVPLIWFVSRFGQPPKEDELKVLCERGA
jgi:uncharacterized protein YndB with AHSA1/START domain